MATNKIQIIGNKFKYKGDSFWRSGKARPQDGGRRAELDLDLPYVEHDGRNRRVMFVMNQSENGWQMSVLASCHYHA